MEEFTTEGTEGHAEDEEGAEHFEKRETEVDANGILPIGERQDRDGAFDLLTGDAS
jgi:hypothetical protein